MFDTVDNAYSIDKKIYYSIVRSMVIQSLEKIVREDLNQHTGSIMRNTTAADKTDKIAITLPRSILQKIEKSSYRLFWL